METSNLDKLNLEIRKIHRNLKSKCIVRDFKDSYRHTRLAYRYYDKPQMELVVLLASTQCNWNNCRMCGLSIIGEKVSEENLLKQISSLKKIKAFHKVNSIFISSYSNFDPNQISSRARMALYNTINEQKNIETVVLMTRANLVKENYIKEIRKFLPIQKIIILFGLETANEFIAKYCIDKGYMWTDVVRASKILKKYNCDTGVWVLLKPPFLTESEAIKDAVDTIKKSIQNDFWIRIMPNEVMAYTLTEFLHKQNKYRPPWLWSVIEVLKQFNAEQLKKIDVSGPPFELENPNDCVIPRELHSSEILLHPHNCGKCDKKVREAILRYKKERNLVVFNGLNCECKKEWKKDLEEKLSPRNKRLEKEFTSIIKSYEGK